MIRYNISSRIISAAGILATMGDVGRSSPSDEDDNDSSNSNSGDDGTASGVPSESDNNMSGNESEATSSLDGSTWSFPEPDGTNWNPMIPRTSWAIHVGNAPYAGSPALITPRPEGSKTSMD
jgi:hypothetical protein